MDVDSVEERAGNAVAIAFNLSGRATALALRISEKSARAGIHRGDENKAGGEGHRARGAADCDFSILQWLAHDLERGAFELWQLIEEQDAVVRKADLPGLGDSAMPEGVSTPEGVAEILARGLDHILPAGSRYDLAGFSFGALCSGHLAALDQDRVRSLTIIGAGALGFQRSPTQLVKVRALSGDERVASHRHNLAELMFADASKIDDVALAIQEASTRGARFKSRGFASTDSLKQALLRGRGQLNAIYGEWDAIVRPNVQWRLDLVHGLRPGARAHAIPGAGHWVAYEAAEEFNATLSRFLTERA